MEYGLTSPVEVASKIGDRLILVHATGDSEAFVTVDFEFRRWQLGNHPLRMLNHGGSTFRGRNWQARLVQDATNALLGVPSEEPQGGAFVEDALAIHTDEPLDVPEPVTQASSEVTADVKVKPTTLPVGGQEPSFPAGMIAYAWKRLQDSQLSQDITAPTPEALFVLAGFRPHKVLESI
jgi:hypothetical protein